jgi:glycosyltransferase involved in cell wall biosynthesis
MINVAYITSTLEAGGEERQWAETLRVLDPRKHRIVNVCLFEPGSVGEELIREGHRFRQNVFAGRFDVLAVFKLARILKEERTDIVFLSYHAVTVFYGIVAAKIAGAGKIITSIHSTGFFDKKREYTLVKLLSTRFFDRIIAAGKAHKDYLADSMGFPRDRITAIPYGLDMGPYQAPADIAFIRMSLGIPPDSKVVGIVARLNHIKRHDIFLRSAAAVLRSRPGTVFLIIGDGAERPAIERLVKELNIGDNVRMAGFRKDIADILKMIDVSVLTSDNECMPVSIVESMASGVPVVSTRVGSVPDMISEGVTGYTAPAGSHEALAEKIVKILGDADLAKKMGEAGRRIAGEKYSLSALKRNYEELFAALAPDKV